MASDEVMQDVMIDDAENIMINPKSSSELAPVFKQSQSNLSIPGGERSFIRSPLKPHNRSPPRKSPPNGDKSGSRSPVKSLSGRTLPSPRRLLLERRNGQGSGLVMSRIPAVEKIAGRSISAEDEGLSSFSRGSLSRASSGPGSGQASPALGSLAQVSPAFGALSLSASPRTSADGSSFFISGQRSKDFDSFTLGERELGDPIAATGEPGTTIKRASEAHSHLRIEIPRFSVGDAALESPSDPKPPALPALDMSSLQRGGSFHKPIQPSSRAPLPRQSSDGLIAGLPVQSPVGDGPDFDLMSPSSPALLATPARSADAGQSAVFNFLTPDATGFEQRSLTKKSDSLSQPKKKECPPTPDRLQAVPLKRMSSLHEEKILKAFWGDEPPASMDFTEYRLIGEGAFFQVARVKDKRTGKYYAMKKAKKRFRGKKDREEYLKEVEVLATLKPHENIVRYYQAWQDDGHFYLLMEYCAGNLNELVNQTLSKPPYRIGEDLLLRICRQVAMGLNHIHASNILHLDIKPANILVTSNCTFKLGDFGHSILKKDWKDGHEGDSTYIAPELLSSRLSGVALISPLSGIGPSSPLVMQFSPVSPMASLQGPSPLASPVGGGSAPASPALVNTKADIFSLGLLLFELATGRDLPQNGRLWQKLRQGSDRAALFLKTKSGIDPNFQDLIISMMNPNPLLRPTAARIIELLDLHMPQRQAPAAPAAAAVAPPQ